MTNYFSRIQTIFYITAVIFSCSIFTPQLRAEEAAITDEVKDIVDDAQLDNTLTDDAQVPDPSLGIESAAQPAVSGVVAEQDTSYTVKKGDSLYVIAKKNDVTIGNLKKANDLTSDLIKPGMVLKIPKAKFSILVDKSDNTLQLLSNSQPYKTYSVATGKDNSTPVGEFKVTVKLENPTWYSAGAVVEPGSPENILGTRWIGYSLKGYGIHGTTMPETIGTQASAGCVRMHNEEVEELYDLVTPGTVVTVQD